MENQLFDCLFANLIGFGKQFLPKGQIALSGEGQNAFFDILAEKMGGTENIPFFTMPADAEAESEAEVPQGEDAGAADAGRGPVAASLDPGEITVLVSSLLSSQDLSLAVDKVFENKDTAAPADIIGFLRDVLDVLSDGDQIELKSEEGTETLAALPGEEGADDDTVERAGENGPFMGQLASIIHQLNRLASQGNEKANVQPQTDVHVPGAKTPVIPMETKKPDPTYPVADQMKEAKQVIVNEDQEAPAFVVEVVKAVKKAEVKEISSNRELRPQAEVQLPAAEEAADARDDLLIVPGRRNTVDENVKEPKKVVIRVSDAKGAEIGDRENDRMVTHHDNSRHTVQNASETKAAAKNDFGAMMVDKIEKMTEQFAGRNINMDMVVRLKIDEKDTLLVGLKEDGGRVTVELRSTNENMMNLLQSQKEDITKNLEAKNIHASIHVDLNQDGSGRRDRKNDGGGKDEDEQDGQDFGSFIEALS